MRPRDDVLDLPLRSVRVRFSDSAESMGLLIYGAVMLLLAVFIGRIYCRFACPYGALLRLISPLAKWRVTVTPDECVQCRLCEDACPFGEIRYPTPDAINAGRQRTPGDAAGPAAGVDRAGRGAGIYGQRQARDAGPQGRLAERVWVEDHKTPEQKAVEQATG